MKSEKVAKQQTASADCIEDNAVNGIKIFSISVTRSAGRGGSTTTILKPDSVIFEPGRRLLNEGPGFRKKINNDDWGKLESEIDYEALDKVRSGESRAPYDGPDFIVEIKTSLKDYRLVNVEDSLQNEQLLSLENRLNRIVSKAK